MSLYKHRYEYNEDEDVIFGGWAIALAIGTGLIGVIGGTYSICCMKDIFVAHGLKADAIPFAHLVITMVVSAFSLAFGVLNLLAYARRFNIPKLPKRTYKFKD